MYDSYDEIPMNTPFTGNSRAKIAIYQRLESFSEQSLVVQWIQWNELEVK
jgi:hypothetical protein